MISNIVIVGASSDFNKEIEWARDTEWHESSTVGMALNHYLFPLQALVVSWLAWLSTIMNGKVAPDVQRFQLVPPDLDAAPFFLTNASAQVTPGSPLRSSVTSRIANYIRSPPVPSAFSGHESSTAGMALNHYLFPPQFRGFEDDADAWLDTINMLGSHRDCTDEEKWHVATSHLRDAAESWVECRTMSIRDFGRLSRVDNQTSTANATCKTHSTNGAPARSTNLIFADGHSDPQNLGGDCVLIIDIR
ncbi:hypothetical protein HPB50_010967 [Hyalomma asiaticum]|uniref:Uncharacterized protein n=1 Tax=Hyalomma asiaticum TaxID=266040 RepID=A0ACB7SRU4_HYAAI|nr:hypothetical protein HPB50_010967 [Hyalomma asiaticum]